MLGWLFKVMRRKFCGKRCCAHQHSVFCDFHSLPGKEVMGPLKWVYMVSQEGTQVPTESFPKAVDCRFDFWIFWNVLLQVLLSGTPFVGGPSVPNGWRASPSRDVCQVGFVIIDDFLPENMARAMKVLCFDRDWDGWGSPRLEFSSWGCKLYIYIHTLPHRCTARSWDATLQLWPNTRFFRVLFYLTKWNRNHRVLQINVKMSTNFQTSNLGKKSMSTSMATELCPGEQHEALWGVGDAGGSHHWWSGSSGVDNAKEPYHPLALTSLILQRS